MSLKNRMWITLTHEKQGLHPSVTRKHTLTNTALSLLCLVFTANCNLRLSHTTLQQRPPKPHLTEQHDRNLNLLLKVNLNGSREKENPTSNEKI